MSENYISNFDVFKFLKDFFTVFKLYPSCSDVVNIGIKHGFPCINVCQVPREVLKTEAEGRGFQHLPRDLANVKDLLPYWEYKNDLVKYFMQQIQNGLIINLINSLTNNIC